MVAVVVGVEDVLHGLAGNLLGGVHRGASAARKIRIHHDEVILHLDDGVVAMSQGLDFAFAKPHAWNNLFYGAGRDIACGHEKGHRAQEGEYTQYPDTAFNHERRSPCEDAHASAPPYDKARKLSSRCQ